MQGKKTAIEEYSQKNKKIKPIKVLYSNAHNDRPKISMEGKWLEQLGFHIGDKLQVIYGSVLFSSPCCGWGADTGSK